MAGFVQDWVRILARAVCALGVFAMGHDVWGQIPCRYEVSHVIQGPGCGFGIFRPTVGTAISPNGRYVVGNWQQCEIGHRAFVYDTTTSQFSLLPLPTGVVSSTASDVNDSGLIVGQYETTLPAGYRGFVYDILNGQYAQLDPLPGGAWCGANAINASGVVCGFRSIGSPKDPVNPQTAYMWSAKEGFTDLGMIDGQRTAALDINDDGVAIVITGVGLDTFLWTKDTLVKLPTEPDTWIVGLALNNKGEVVGHVDRLIPQPPGLGSRAFIWDGNQLLDLGTLPGDDRSVAQGVNSGAIIVGLSRSFNQADHAFIWHAGKMLEIATLMVDSSGLGPIRNASSISESNEIVAHTTTTHGSITIVLRPTVPSPTDIDRNCRTDMDDLLHVINAWGSFDSPADVDHDGIVGVSDLQLVLESWSF